MEVQLGISKPACKSIAEAMQKVLADTYALYLKTQNFHWNLIGPEFFPLHLLFEKQYEDLADAVDEIAERIRAVGFYAEASFSAFAKNTTISEPKGKLESKKMVKELLEGHELIAREGKPLIRKFQEFHDEASADLLIKRLGIHEKAAWMLRAHLEV
ncbi:MAG: DNA starvation/stationary phase protection protein [Chlamydiia bacterium]|nr:DNA starvation/stationary phase protection protein [Chlamydiia bacterium]